MVYIVETRPHLLIECDPPCSVRTKKCMVFLLFIRDFECSDRGGDVIK